jgi:hypothetical protein
MSFKKKFNISNLEILKMLIKLRLTKEIFDSYIFSALDT